MPNVFGASLHLLQKLGLESIDAIEEQTGPCFQFFELPLRRSVAYVTRILFYNLRFDNFYNSLSDMSSEMYLTSEGTKLKI